MLNYQTITTKNGIAGYVKLGNGADNLVMLVGYSGNLLHWNSELINKLAEFYTVYLLDNRLVGLSDSTNAETISGFADDVADFIYALNLAQCRVFGWSMGGIIAQSIAINYPKLLSGLVLMVSQPDYSYTYGNLHNVVSELRNNPNKQNRDRLMELFYSEEPSIEFRKYLAKNTLRIDAYIYPFSNKAQALQDLAVSNHVADYSKIEQINIPTIIFTAVNDKVTKTEASYILHKLIKTSKLISYNSGGHFFMNYNSLEVANDLIRYFEKT
ncbi:MAG: alpha/beta hydrolase [Burkholderiales bacterium]|nr:alpha/beta hydrolase [Burkholderiales bacterium]